MALVEPLTLRWHQGNADHPTPGKEPLDPPGSDDYSQVGYVVKSASDLLKLDVHPRRFAFLEKPAVELLELNTTRVSQHAHLLPHPDMGDVCLRHVTLPDVSSHFRSIVFPC